MYNAVMSKNTYLIIFSIIAIGIGLKLFSHNLEKMKIPAEKVLVMTATTTTPGPVIPFEKTTYVKPSDEVLKQTLTPLQYEVTQREGTETPYNNKYWDNKEEGIYVDIVSGEPLYSSTDKYDSGTGWPSFTKPIWPDVITIKEVNDVYGVRTEVRSRYADSHLGHVFNDGPSDRGGLRFCMNSAAMRFIPKAELKGTVYEKYLINFN